MLLRPTKSLQIWCGLGILLLGLAVRWPHLNQSLWYDEMTTTVDYVLQPWQKILAAKAGEYVPNNHVFHTILVKLIYAPGADAQVSPPIEIMLRLPAVLAGVLVPLALAWPLRRSNPLMALLVAIVAALHPGLLAFSTECRGYSLMLLLVILATNCLPLSSRRLTVAYVITLTLAIYTVPLAVLLVPGHALVMLVLFRSGVRRWLIAVGVALLLTTTLYLPMVHGLIAYYRHPYLATMNYRSFLDGLPRFALAGSWTSQSAIYWALPVLTIIFGSVLGWSQAALRPLLIALGVTTLLGVLLPLVVPGAAEPRFVSWILPWFCVSAVAVLCSAKSNWARAAAALGFVTLSSWLLMVDINQPPNQQIREGIALADNIVPPGRDIMVLYLGAREATILYGRIRHALLPAPDATFVALAQQQAIADTGHPAWVIIFYAQKAEQRDFYAPESRGLWTGLTKHYHLVKRIPGRIDSVAIYAPNQDG